MEKEFVSYEQALALKELGFDEPCFAFWVYDESNKEDIPEIFICRVYDQILGKFLIKNSNANDGVTAALLYQQAFRFFREEYNLVGMIEGGWDSKLVFTTMIWDGSKDIIDYVYFDTYEEAEQACLSKLIEIAKQ